MTVTITGSVKDVTGVADNEAPWMFASVIRFADDGSVITETPREVRPVAGNIKVELEPGYAIVTYGKHVWQVTVPTTPTTLKALIEAGVAYPPDTAQELLNAAVAEIAPGLVADELQAQTADAVDADLASRSIGFVDEGSGTGHFTVGGVPVSGTLVPPAATWSGVAGKPEQINSLTDGPVLDAEPKMIYTDTLHNGFPHLMRRKDGLLIMVWRRGSTHSGGRGQIRIAYSNDNGNTWRNSAGLTSTTVLANSSDQVQLDDLLDSRDACLFELSDGRIVLSYFLRQWNPYAWDADGRACIRISEDGGLTFGPEIQLPATFTGFIGHSSPVIELPGGVVWQPVFGGDNTINDPRVITYLTSTLETMHEVEGWEMSPTPIYNGSEIASECHIILNAANDGVIAAVRFDDAKQTRIFRKPLSGGSWTQAGQFSALSAPRMLRTASGRILVPHRRGAGYGDVSRSALAYSDDDGYTWRGAEIDPLYLDSYTDRTYAYAGIVEVRPGACRVVYGSERNADGQSEVLSRPLAVHPVHAPARLEVPAAPWASTSAATTVPVDAHPVVYFNATKDGRSDGETLVRWHDRSGNMRHGVPGSSAPVYDIDEEGRLCLLFDGVDDCVDIPMLLGNSLWHSLVMVVARLETPSPGGNVQVLLTTRTSSSANNGWELQWRGTDAVIRQGIGTGTPYLSSIPVTPGTTPLAVSCSLDPAIARMAVGGGVRTTTSGISYTAPSGVVTRIGNSISGTSVPFQGRIYGFAASEHSMTSEELIQQATWLAEQCGVSSG